MLITTGATFEAIDPVRGITNISSGQMGIALARLPRRRCRSLRWLTRSNRSAAGHGQQVHALSAQAMHEAVRTTAFIRQDIFISVAAIADYKVRNSSTQKLKKSSNNTPPVIELAEKPDIICSFAALPDAPFCIGFSKPQRARTRMAPDIPMLVANEVSVAMGGSRNR